MLRGTMRIPCLAEGLLACQEVLCSIKCVGWLVSRSVGWLVGWLVRDKRCSYLFHYSVNSHFSTLLKEKVETGG
jgi:hypothetical protein